MSSHMLRGRQLSRDTEHRKALRRNLVQSLFEKHLKEDPGQWSVLDRIWPEDLPATPPAPDEQLAGPAEDQAVQ